MRTAKAAFNMSNEKAILAYMGLSFLAWVFLVFAIHRYREKYRGL